MDNPRENSVRALEKALIVLEHLSRIEGDIDLATLTQELDMPKTTLLRLLNTLKKHNFVHQDERSRRYRLGWALIYLGQAANKAFDIVEFIHPFLEKLSRKCGETANLVFLDRNHAVYVDQVVSDNIIRGVPAVGAPLGLHCTAAGKVLLSSQSDDRIAEILKAIKLVPLTTKTITDLPQLREELKRVRDQGCAVDDEETEMGGRCVAAPIYGKQGALVGAISVMGPTNRVNPETIAALSAMVRDCAEEISRALGHRGNP
ncbi:MAG: IclR family transcriptional regulator [Spirochaetaceae bacterium]|nr:MAG: IclR family transcriptional regulator [Spirochaetaceae bacterium]